MNRFKEVLPHLVRGARVSTAIGLSILLGTYFFSETHAIGMIVGALLVGLADFDAPWSHRAINGFAVAISLTLISFFTTYLRNYPLILLVFISVMFFAIGFLYTTSVRFFFLGFFSLAQVAISLALPRGLVDALQYSGLVFGGGMVYIFMIAMFNVMFWLLHIRRYWWYDNQEIEAVKNQIQLIRKKIFRQLRFSSEATWGGFKMSSIAVFVVVIGETFAIPEYYWMLLAVVVILRPVYSETISRAKARFVGTLLGLGLAWVLLTYLPHTWQRFIAVYCCALLAFTYIMHTYYIAVIFITPLALLLFSIGRYESEEVFFIRAINNIAGVAISLIGSYAIEKWYAYFSAMRRKYARGSSAKKF